MAKNNLVRESCMAEKTKVERFDALDGLRTLAALCIVAMHVALNLNFSAEFLLKSTFAI